MDAQQIEPGKSCVASRLNRKVMVQDKNFNKI
jgi:hypothetical protein